MKEIQQRWKHDRQRQNEELMKFYRENKINPAASCLPIVLQIPIFISLFYVLKDFEREIFPSYPGSCLEWLGLVDITRADDRELGPAPARRLRREPADLVVLHVDLDAEGAADPDDGPADRLHPVRPPLPGGADDLLDDDEPVDDRSGLRHAQADAEGRTSARSAARARRRRTSRSRRRRRRSRARGRSSRRPSRRTARHARSPARRGASSASAAEGAADGERRGLRRGDGGDRRRGEMGRAPGARAARARDRPRRRAVPGRERGRARAARRRLHACARARDGRPPARSSGSPPGGRRRGRAGGRS